jgi:DNA-binding LacI/PurR family transcriptional regulator
MEAAMTNGITIRNEFLRPLENLSTQTHEEVMNNFADFTENFVKDKKISALFCTNDFYALSLYRILTAKGIAIPEELSLIGCGRADLKLFESPVATVAYDWHELAKVAVRLLKDMIDGRKIRPQIEITVNPIVHYGYTIGKPGI